MVLNCAYVLTRLTYSISSSFVLWREWGFGFPSRPVQIATGVNPFKQMAEILNPQAPAAALLEGGKVSSFAFRFRFNLTGLP